MKKILTLAVFSLATIGVISCKKSSSSSPSSPTGGLAANTFKMDDTISTTTSSSITANISTFMSAIYTVSLPGSGTDRIGIYFKQKPTASGTYKVSHTYPASNLAANEGFIDVNYGGCNYVTADTSQTITVIVNGGNINVQFSNLTYSFNNWVVLGNPTPRTGGKISGNLNFQ